MRNFAFLKYFVKYYIKGLTFHCFNFVFATHDTVSSIMVYVLVLKFVLLFAGSIALFWKKMRLVKREAIYKWLKKGKSNTAWNSKPLCFVSSTRSEEHQSTVCNFAGLVLNRVGPHLQWQWTFVPMPVIPWRRNIAVYC